MIQNNFWQKFCSGQHVVPVYGITDCHSEAVPQNCVLCDNLREKEGMQGANTTRVWMQRLSKEIKKQSRLFLSWHFWVGCLALFTSISPHVCSAFSPRSRVQLKSAVDACLKLSPKGKCLNSQHGPIGTWDVSRITDMSRLFARAKWFDSDISRWDVSRVKDMHGMFLGATSFNGDISKWDVSRVHNMNGMFLGATQFKRTLHGSAWVKSNANKESMFEGSSASIPEVPWTGYRWMKPQAFKEPMSEGSATTIAPYAFIAYSKEELQNAVDIYLHYLDTGAHDPHLPIGEWDVSRVTDMSHVFFAAPTFNADISKWDVSRVTCMHSMFRYSTGFNRDISKWDVSKVTDMSVMFEDAQRFNCDISKWNVSSVEMMFKMFKGATRFKRVLCTPAWVHSKANKTLMFEGSPGSISSTVCEVTAASTAFSPQSRAELKGAVDTHVEDSVCETATDKREVGGGTVR